MTIETKRFPLRVVLTVTTGRLLTASNEHGNGIEALYEILGWMTNDTPYTHQLPRFINECKPWLLKWFPELAEADKHLEKLDSVLGEIDRDKRDDIELALCCWLGILQELCGLKQFYDVPRIPAGEHTAMDPLAELVAMRGGTEGIIVVKT